MEETRCSLLAGVTDGCDGRPFGGGAGDRGGWALSSLSPKSSLAVEARPSQIRWKTRRSGMKTVPACCHGKHVCAPFTHFTTAALLLFAKNVFLRHCHRHLLSCVSRAICPRPTMAGVLLCTLMDRQLFSHCPRHSSVPTPPPGPQVAGQAPWS